MTSKELIESRINNFLGYGNIDSNIWFVCMEEGFDGTLEDLSLRLDATKDKTIIDIQSDMAGVPDHMRYFIGEHPPIQRTWSKMILMLGAFDSENFLTEDVRSYQKNRFGRLNSNHCILDFMPLPSRSINEADWNYSDFGIDYLESRSTYLRKIMPFRISLFQGYIKERHPQNIIFCSRTYLPYWLEISGCKFKQMNGFHFCERGGINYFVVPHPTAYGIRNADWIRMTNEIKVLSKME